MKIFICAGVHHRPFKRLFQEVKNNSFFKNHEVIFQTGKIKETIDGIQCAQYFTKEEYDHLLQTSDVVVCQGGLSTIKDALSLNEHVIVFPRNKEYKETTSVLQENNAAYFKEHNHCLVINEVHELVHAIENSKNKELVPYHSTDIEIYNEIKEYLTLTRK